MERLREIDRQLEIEQKCRQGAQNLKKTISDPSMISLCDSNISEAEQRIAYLSIERQKLLYSRSDSLSSIAATREVTTLFDYWLSYPSITGDMVQFKLQEIQRKLDIEEKVKTGTEKMVQAVNQNSDIDIKRVQDVEQRYKESHDKHNLLKKSIQKYKSLSLTLDSQDMDSKTKINQKTFSGAIRFKLWSITNLVGKKTSKSEHFVIFRIDGSVKYTYRPGRQWKSDDVELSVEKGNELEIEVYEKDGCILAMMWCYLRDLETACKLKTIQSKQEGDMHEDKHNRFIIALEPCGQMNVEVEMTPHRTSLRRTKDIVRRPPVKKIFPKRGHMFVGAQFYQPMKCAMCSEFLLNGQGYQCQQCKYTCHQRCKEKVLIKCVSDNGNGEKSQFVEQMMKHRIPHRFQPSPSLTAAWCCHCGYMLPIGRRQSLKCTECDTFCHKECAPLVPDFCGLNAGLIDHMIRELEFAEQRRERKGTTHSSSSDPDKKQQSFEKHRRFSEDKKRLHLSLPAFFNHFTIHSSSSLHSNEDTTLKSPSKSTKRSLSHKPSTKTLPPEIMKQHRVPYSVLMPHGVGLEDFSFMAVLGKGNFGKVMLAEDRYCARRYAVKVIKKEFVIRHDEVESTKVEKQIFLVVNHDQHPFLVNLHSCFQTQSRLYFVMEYISGGDLMWHIKKRRFTEGQARLYAAEILLALKYFHENNIIYRDLKLDNILMTTEGHVKLADYGLCKPNMPYGSVTNTFCGTPEFMAPEILKNKPYGRPVDWWAFGVLLYEMLLGQPPFFGNDEQEIFKFILEEEVMYPDTLTPDAADLIRKLLVKDPNNRLGSSKADAHDIMETDYFKGVDWHAILNLEIVPSYKPRLMGINDISHFETQFTREIPVLTPCDSILSLVEQEEFRGFTHISQWAQDLRMDFMSQRMYSSGR